MVAPFAPSKTLDNLRRESSAVLNFTDDVSVIAGCLTGRKTWELTPAEKIDGWRLSDTLAHRELSLLRSESDPERPKFFFETQFEQAHGVFHGFNRAQAAVLEAAILLSRLDWLPAAKVAQEMTYLSIAIEKTAGPREALGWSWIVQAIQAHDKHDISELFVS